MPLLLRAVVRRAVVSGAGSSCVEVGAVDGVRVAGLLLAERVQGPLQLGGDFCAEGVRVTSQPIADTDFYLYVLARPGAVGTCSPDPAATAPADAATCAAVATRSACVSEAGCAYAATSTLAVGRACETDQFGRPISGKPIDVI